MSQYPSPYTPPPSPPGWGYGYPADYRHGADPLWPAHRASTLMFVLGGLVLVGSLCCGVVGAMFPRLVAEQPELYARMNLSASITPELVRTQLLFVSSAAAVCGFIFLILAALVRKGTKVPIVVSLVFSSVTAMALLLIALGSITGPGNPGERLLTALCVAVLPLSLVILLIVWLVQAVRMSSQVAAMRQQQQQQYWQYWQNQQTYNMGGYPQQMPPPPPAGPGPTEPPAPPPPGPPPEQDR